MKRKVTFFLAIIGAAVLAASCAISGTVGANDAEKAYFDAWMKVNYPNAVKYGLGIYIIEDQEGNGELLGDAEKSPYLYGTYSSQSLDGTINDYMDAQTAKQLGTYDTTYYYGNQIWNRVDGLMAGIEEALKTMRTGGTRKVVIPSWLLTSDKHDTEEEYLKNANSTPAGIYTIHIDEVIQDVTKWEVDSIENYISKYHPGTDSLFFGYYYVQLEPPTDTTEFSSGSEVSIDYTGKLLNGTVFDTTVEDTAKVHNLFSYASTYEPTYFTTNDDNTKITLGSSDSSTIKGFSYGLSRMRTGERGLLIFYSSLGYGSSGSGQAIPKYSPLIFEIKVYGKKD